MLSLANKKSTNSYDKIDLWYHLSHNEIYLTHLYRTLISSRELLSPSWSSTNWQRTIKRKECTSKMPWLLPMTSSLITYRSKQRTSETKFIQYPDFNHFCQSMWTATITVEPKGRFLCLQLYVDEAINSIILYEKWLITLLLPNP